MQSQERLSGYHWFMDRMRKHGKLFFWCSCGVRTFVKEDMPLRMKCLCKRQMIVIDGEDLP